MKKTVLVVWLCWWMCQCLCTQYLQAQALKPNPRPHTWRPSLRHNADGQRHPPPNVISRNSSHPAPGITQGTYYSTGNTSQIVSTMNKTDKVHYGTSKDSSREHTVSPSVPPVNINTEDPRHSADKNFSTVDDTTLDKGNQEDPLKDPPSEYEPHGESSLSSRPTHEHKPVHMTGNLSTPENSTAAGRSEGLISLALFMTYKLFIHIFHKLLMHFSIQEFPP